MAETAAQRRAREAQEAEAAGQTGDGGSQDSTSGETGTGAATAAPAGTTSTSSAGGGIGIVTTQAELDAREAVERSRTDPAVAGAGPATSGGNLQPGGRLAPIVNDLNDGPSAAEAAQAAAEEGHATGDTRPMVTRMEGEQVGTVGHTAPGDAPYDTTDPNERVSTVIPSGEQMAAAAKAGLGSVVAGVKTGELAVLEPEDGGRVETYDVLDGFGNVAGRVERNIDTGISRRVGDGG